MANPGAPLSAQEVLKVPLCEPGLYPCLGDKDVTSLTGLALSTHDLCDGSRQSSHYDDRVRLQQQGGLCKLPALALSCLQ